MVQKLKKSRTTLYLDEKLYKEIKDEAEKKGLSINQLIASKLYESMIDKDLHHHNVYENHVTIWDGRIRKLVDVYLIRQKDNTVLLSCSEDLNSTCDHCQFTKRVGKVQDTLNKEGLKFA